MKELDYNIIHEPIRNVVMLLRKYGFETTDSGDGVTNVEAGMEYAMAVPHVVVKTSYEKMIASARYIRYLLRVHGGMKDIRPGNIQATYDPVNEVAIIMISEVTNLEIPKFKPNETYDVFNQDYMRIVERTPKFWELDPTGKVFDLLND